jgi:hypothetical protein
MGRKKAGNESIGEKQNETGKEENNFQYPVHFSNFHPFSNSLPLFSFSFLHFLIVPLHFLL